MSQAITGIDHPVVLVRNLDAARSAYQRLGFLTSPRGLQTEQVGTHNHTLMLEGDYVELLGIRAPTELNGRLRQALEQREGVHLVALRTADAGAAARELRARGIAASDPATFTRPIETPAGPAELGFTITVVPEEATPGAIVFACQHLTPEHVWRPELRRHRNTAERLASITVVANDVTTVARSYAALFGSEVAVADAADRRGRAAAVATGGVPIAVLTPDALAERCPGVDLGGITPPAIAGLGIKVRDPRAARVCLDDAGIVPVEVAGGGGFCVPPRRTCGVLVEFRG